LLSLPAGGGGAASSVAGGQDPVLHHLGVMGRPISGYSLPPQNHFNPLPYRGSNSARRMDGWRGENVLWSPV